LSILLIPILFGLEALWVFGPQWAWIPFTAIYGLLLVYFIILGITVGLMKVRDMFPASGNGFATVLCYTQWSMVLVFIGLLIYEQYWELILCAAFFVVSAFIWPKLSTVLKYEVDSIRYS
jgi:hypothetical protein